MIQVLVAEIIQSWRALLRKPGYLVLSVVTLALGISACIVVFALIRASLFSPIAVPEIDRVAVVGPQIGEGVGGLAPIQFLQLHGLDGTQSIGIASSTTTTLNIHVDGRSVPLTGWRVDAGFLSALGQPMLMGRGFTNDESRPGGPRVAIISEGFWRQAMGARPDILDQSVRIEGTPTRIVGVLSSRFPFNHADILLPLAVEPATATWSGSNLVIARLMPGMSLEALSQAAMARLRPLDEQHGLDRLANHGTYGVRPLEAALRAGRGGADNILTLFAVAAGVVLAIVVVNLSNLALLRSLAGGRDHAIRQALGAPLSRLLLPEVGAQLLVAMCGATLGLVTAHVVLTVVDGVLPPEWFISADARPEIGMVGIVLAVCLALVVVVVALATGLLRSRRPLTREALSGGDRVGVNQMSGAVGRALVSLQAGMAMVLLILTSLSALSLFAAATKDFGFDSENVLAFSVKPNRDIYPDQQSVLLMADAIVDRLQTVPGIQVVAYGTNLPASGTSHFDTAPFLQGERVLESVPSYLVSQGYMKALGVRLTQGTDFERDRGSNANSILISEQLAAHIPGATAVGERLVLPLHLVNSDWPALPLRIRGVTAGLMVNGVTGGTPPVVWMNFGPETAVIFDLWRDANDLYFMVRVSGDPLAYRDQVLTTVREVAPMLAVSRLQPLSAYKAESLAQQQLNLIIVLVFAAAALTLSSVGMYSVMAMSVAQRRRELALRAALGSTPFRLMRGVLAQGAIQTGIGLVIGLIGGFAAAKLMEGLIFGVSPTDLHAIAPAVAVLILSALVACLGPALRAARTEPMQALRSE